MNSLSDFRLQRDGGWSSISGASQTPNSSVRISSLSDTTSAERVLAILEMFERERRPLSLKELSEYCQIPPSTCHNLVQTLLKHSYLYLTGRRKDLYPTR